MKSRRLITTVRPIERRQNDIEGELLPAEDETRALVPVARQTPVIAINLPRAHDDGGDVAPVSEYERRRAQRPVSLEADVKTPVMQTLFTAAAFGASAGLLAWAFAWSWRVPVVIMALTLAGAWLWRLRLVDALLWEIETIAQRDITRDGRIGKPTFAPLVVNPAEARATASQVARANKAQDELAELLTFVTRCANLGTSEAAQGIPPAPAARADFAAKRDTLIALGVARWRDESKRRKGWELAMTPAQATPLLRRHIMGREGTN